MASSDRKVKIPSAVSNELVVTPVETLQMSGEPPVGSQVYCIVQVGSLRPKYASKVKSAS